MAVAFTMAMAGWSIQKIAHVEVAEGGLDGLALGMAIGVLVVAIARTEAICHSTTLGTALQSLLTAVPAIVMFVGYPLDSGDPKM